LTTFSEFLTFKAGVSTENKPGEVKGTGKKLVDLTNAYLAIEGLLRSRFLSHDTRQQLESSMRLLDEEAKRLMKEHADEEESQVA
jgi:hypothetical protein